MKTPTQANWRWTPYEDRKLRELLDAGKNVAEIAVELSRTRHAVYARLHRFSKDERVKPRELG
jgi:hypothetical protein